METETRVRHTIKNVVWTYIYNAIGCIMPFIIRSLIIYYWGLEYLGLNSLFSSVLQVLNISELGIGQAIVVNMYKPAANGDIKEVNKLLSLYAWFYRIIGFLVGVVGLILVPFLPYIISGSYPQEINILFVYFVYLLQSVIGYFAFPYCNAAFAANQKSEKTNKYQAFVWLIIYIIQIFVICYCHNYYLYVILLPIATLFCGIVIYLGMKKWFPLYSLESVKYDTFSKGFLITFVKQISAMALSKLRVVFRNSIDTIIISAFLGIIVVAKYQNYMLIMTVPLIIVNALPAGILPSLGNRVALEKAENNLKIIRLIAFLMQWVAIVCAAFLMCFYQPFVSIWAGKESVLSDTAMVLFVIYFYLKVIGEISTLVRNSSGIWWEGKWIAVFESIINLLLNIILVQFWGIEGIILATVISMLLINIPFETYYVYKYYLGIHPWKDLIDYLINGIIMCFAIGITYFVTRLHISKGIITMVMWVLECLLIPNVIWIMTHLKNQNLVEIIKIGKKMLNLKS